jgi:DNA-binding NarL/FixJ family response regulator
MERMKVLVAYRQRLLRQALRTVLSAQPDVAVVTEAEDGKEAVELAERTSPDVVVMDAQLPVVSGVDATALIRRRGGGARVLLLTLGSDDEQILAMLRAGATGCLLKDAEVDELLLAVRTVHRGGAYHSPRLAERIAQNLVRYAADRSSQAPPSDLLSVREREVLQLVAEGLGNQAIARRLILSVKTVEAHKDHIARKLGIRGRTELIKYAIRTGMIELEGTAEPVRLSA